MSDRLLPEERISPEQTAALLGGDEGGHRSLITNPAPSPPLSIADVPDICAPWPAICEFALSFDGVPFRSGQPRLPDGSRRPAAGRVPSRWRSRTHAAQ